MPVGTLGSVKSLTPDDLRSTAAQCVLANAYHLSQRPGAETVAALGGLHRFTGWSGPMLTDSGGFQVFSLDGLRTIDDDGVTFQSHRNADTIRLTPRSVVSLQEQLGADIVMPLDECVPYPCPPLAAAAAVTRTLEWAAQSARSRARADQALFGIVQGSTYAALRRECADRLVLLDLPGYALGGLSVGEPKTITAEMIVATTPRLPANRPRYLMGVGAPDDLPAYIGLGVDMFDCVLPSRLGRNGTVFTRVGRVNLARGELRSAGGPIEDECTCAVCATHSVGYLAHLFREREPLGARLATLHNIAFLIQLAQGARNAILNGRFPEWQARQPALSDRPAQPVGTGRSTALPRREALLHSAHQSAGQVPTGRAVQEGVVPSLSHSAGHLLAE